MLMNLNVMHLEKYDFGFRQILPVNISIRETRSRHFHILKGKDINFIDRIFIARMIMYFSRLMNNCEKNRMTQRKKNEF